MGKTLARVCGICRTIEIGSGKEAKLFKRGEYKLEDYDFKEVPYLSKECYESLLGKKLNVSAAELRLYPTCDPNRND